MSSPTERTLNKLRKDGALPWKTEYYNQWSRKRHDMYGWCDLVAMMPGNYLLGIQATSGSNVSARVKKILGIPEAKRWLECGLKIEVWGWRKVKKKTARGTTVERWEVRIVPIGLGDF